MWRVNGTVADGVPPDDRGLAYGDGVFETIAVVNGQAALWPAHRQRLLRGCRRLGFEPPPPRMLDAEVETLAGGGHGVIKLVVTRGSGGRGYRPPDTSRPRLLAHRGTLPERPSVWWWQGVRVHRCRTRLGTQPAVAGLKHLNRLEQVLARAEWHDADIAEGLMADEQGNVVAGTASNLFARFGDELCTPPLARRGVAGIMRREVIAMAAAIGLRARIRALSWRELGQADELWLTNSLIGLWPVRAADGRFWRSFDYGHRLLWRMLANGWVAAPAEQRE